MKSSVATSQPDLENIIIIGLWKTGIVLPSSDSYVSSSFRETVKFVYVGNFTSLYILSVNGLSCKPVVALVIV